MKAYLSHFIADSQGRKQLPYTLKFQSLPASFGIMLEYCTNSIQLDEAKTTLMDPQPIVLNYLKEKCSLLTDLYEIIISENPSQYLVNLNINTPVFNLLRHYDKLNMSMIGKHLWFKSALSPQPDRKFFVKQVEFCISSNLWHKALLGLNLYLEYYGKNEHGVILLKQLVLQHISSINLPDAPNYALCIVNPEVRANAVLQNIQKWDEHSALKALKYCLSDCRMLDFPEVHLALKNKLKEIKLYKKVSITKCILIFAL